jgi:hypothetical protein
MVNSAHPQRISPDGCGQRRISLCAFSGVDIAGSTNEAQAARANNPDIPEPEPDHYLEQDL